MIFWIILTREHTIITTQASCSSVSPCFPVFNLPLQCADSCDVQKQNCVWLFVSHHKSTFDDLVRQSLIFFYSYNSAVCRVEGDTVVTCLDVFQMSGLSSSSGDAVLKFEPAVLHVQCRKLEDAQLVVRETLQCWRIYVTKSIILCF